MKCTYSACKVDLRVCAGFTELCGSFDSVREMLMLPFAETLVEREVSGGVESVVERVAVDTARLIVVDRIRADLLRRSSGKLRTSISRTVDTQSCSSALCRSQGAEREKSDRTEDVDVDVLSRCRSDKVSLAKRVSSRI